MTFCYLRLLAHQRTGALLRQFLILGRPVLAVLALLLPLLSYGQGNNKIADFAQFANTNQNTTQKDWTFGILNQQNSSYYEGTASLQRLTLVGLPNTAQLHTLEFRVMALKGNVHAYDFLTSYDQALLDYHTVTGQDLVVNTAEGPAANAVFREQIGTPATAAMIQSLYGSGVSARAHASAASYASLIGHDVEGKVTLYDNGTPSKRDIVIYGQPGSIVSGATLTMDGYEASGAKDSYAKFTLTWTSNSPEILILMAGHLAVSGTTSTDTDAAYPQGKGASFINGGPYHFKLDKLDGVAGSRDNQIMTALRLDCSLTVSGVPTPLACYNDNSGRIEASYGGTAAGPVTYTLTRVLDAAGTEVNEDIAQAGPIFTGLAAGTYQLNATDGTCSAAQYPIVVAQPAELTVGLTAQAVKCYGDATGSIEATASGGTAPYRYALQPAGGVLGAYTAPTAGAYTFSNLAAGSYTVYVLDSHDCATNAATPISQPQAALSATKAVTASGCRGGYALNDGRATITPSGGTLPYRYFLGGTEYGNTPRDAQPYTFTNLMAGSYSVTVKDANDCVFAVPFVIEQNNCYEPHCTLTQGGYGNGNGVICKYAPKTRVQMLNDVLLAAAPAVRIGTSTRYIEYGPGSGQCIIDRMPAGGGADALPSNLMVSFNATCQITTPGVLSSQTTLFNGTLKNGKFNNVLIGQTLTLALNIRLDNTLGAVRLRPTMKSRGATGCTATLDPNTANLVTRTIPAAVITALGGEGTATVSGLLTLANNALGGSKPSALTYTQISDAVAAINELLDNCRMLEIPAQQPVDARFASSPSGVAVAQTLKAFPNPTADQLTVEFELPAGQAYALQVLDMMGRVVSEVSTGRTAVAQQYSFQVGRKLPSGVYLVRLSAGHSSQTLRIFLQK